MGESKRSIGKTKTKTESISKNFLFFVLGNAEIVDLLLKFNANVNSIGMKNMTALLIAAKNGHAETCLRLLENRTIDIKVQDKVTMKNFE